MKADQILVTRLVSKITHDLRGNQISNPQKQDARNSDLHTRLNDRYYTEQMNKPFGIAELIALFESFTGAILWRSSPSPATAINEITCLSEFIQVQAARTNFFGPRDKKETRRKTEGAMAWLQVFAGLGGIASCLFDGITHKKKESEDLPFIQKVGLSALSFLSSMFMFFGAGEKTLIATSTQKNENSNESANMRMNGNSDVRGGVDWLAMSLVPWFSNFQPFKTVLNYLISYSAIREGVTHFLRNGISMVFNDKVIPLSSIPKTLLKIIFLTSGNGVKNGTVSWPFAKKWFLGSEEDRNREGKVEPGSCGFRSKYLLPVLRLFGCNPPVYYFDRNGSIVSEFYEKARQSTSENQTPASLTGEAV